MKVKAWTNSLAVLVVLFVTYYPQQFRAEEKGKEKDQGSKEASQEITLSPEEKQNLLSITRKALEQYLKHGDRVTLNPDTLSPSVRKMRGCFVTLEKKGQLRGCIGYLEPRKPLCDCVIENAINAAVRDTRFPEAVSVEELGSITIEISVLTVPKKLDLKNRQELPGHLVAGRDGLILRRGWHQATFLPQVWEHFPEKKEFLDSLCQKGGMPAGCWEDEDTEIFTYQAEVFHE